MVRKWSQQTTVIKGRPRHPQSNGCIEQANGTMKRMLQSLMADESTREWAKFIPRVQCTVLWPATICACMQSYIHVYDTYIYKCSLYQIYSYHEHTAPFGN